MPQTSLPFKNHTCFRVRYAETDQMGIVHHANYFVWMEIGRVELVRSLGVDHRDLEQKEGLLLSVINASSRYIYPARYDQEVRVETELVMVNSRMVEFSYQIFSMDPEKLLAEGATRHLWLNRNLRPSRLPAHVLHRLTSGLPPKFGGVVEESEGLSPEKEVEVVR